MAIQLTPAPGSMENMLSMEAPIDTAPGGEAQSQSPQSYRPIFSYVNPSQLDADPTGDMTMQYAQQTGQALTRDDVLELNVGGRIMSRDQLRNVAGGEALLDLAKKNRQGRKDFLGGIGEGAGTDFVPFVADIASLGTSVANMSKMRDSLKKVQDEGMDSLSDQDRVWISLYEQDSLRNQNATWGGTVGSIIRQAPAFAMEFALTGGLHKIATKAISKGSSEILEAGVEKGLAEAVTKMTEQSLKSTFRNTMTKGVARGAVEVPKEVIEKAADDAVVAAIQKVGAGGLDEAGQAFVRSRAITAGTAFAEAYKNPKLVKQWGDFLTEFGKRGFSSHYDDILGEGVEKSVKDRLREFAGVALIEAPIRGSMYATFDFAVANPIIAKAMGADEAVTRSELMFASSDNKPVRDGAKFLAWGTALTEYASENAGGAFNALGNIVRDKALAPATKGLVSKGLRAILPKDMGSFVSDAIEKTTGTKAAIRGAIDRTKREALEQVINAPDDINNAILSGFKSRIAGKSIDEILKADTKLVDDVVKNTLTARDKSFFGFVLADKMSATGATPDKIIKGFKVMGYDEILGEFMEERYNGFAQGLFGFDGSSEEEMGVMGRLAYASKQAIPETGQGFAEIVAFAIPMVGRSMLTKAYAGLDAGFLGRAKGFANDFNALVESTRGTMSTEGKSSLENVTQVKGTDAAASEAARVAQGLGTTRASSQYAFGNQERAAEQLRLLASDWKRISEVEEGVIKKGAKMLLKTAEAVLTGNPFALFNDQAGAVMYDRMGKSGHELLTMARNQHDYFFKDAAAKIAQEEATKAGVTELTEADIAAFIRRAGSREAIEARIEPLMRTTSKMMISEYMARRGSMVVTDDMVDRELSRIAEDREAKGNKMTDDQKANFRKDFKTQLVEVAKGKMYFEEVNGVGQFRVSRENDQNEGDVFRAIDRMLHTEFGSFGFLDASKASNPRESLAESGTRFDAKLVDAILADDMEATIRGAREWGIGLGRSVAEISTGATLARVKEYARIIRAVADMQGTQYKVGDVPVSIIKGADGKYAATGLAQPITGASFLDVETQLLKQGAVRTSKNIIETSTQAVWMQHASAALHKSFPRSDLYGATDAMKEGWRKAGNPYLDPSFAEDFTAARAEADKLIAESLRDTGAVPKWEADAAAFLTTIGGRERDNPAQRGQKGYLLAFGALNDGDNVYISRHRTNGVIGLIEDVIENMEKGDERRANVFLMGGEYRPAVQEFFKVVAQAAKNYAAEQDAVAAKKGHTETFARAQADRARRVEQMFNPAVQNLEARSKAIVSFGLMFARDNAEVGGHAYYDILTKIAPAVNSSPEAIEFRSLVGRFVDPTGSSGVISGETGMLDEGGGFLTSLMKNLAPADLRDTALPGLPGSRGALELPAETGKQLKDRVAQARRGEMFQEGMDEATKQQYVQAVRERYGKPGMNEGYLPEDIPALVKQLAASMLGGNVNKYDAGVGAAANMNPAEQDANKANAEGAAEADQAKDIDQANKDQGEHGDNPISPSIMNMLASPQMAIFAFAFASTASTHKGLMFSRPVSTKKLNIGVDDDVRQAFDFWKMWAPDLGKDMFEVFKGNVRDVIKETPRANDDSDNLAPEGVDAFADNAARDHLAENAQVSAFRSVMQAYGATMGELPKTISDLHSLDLKEGGSYDEDSITALFDAQTKQTPHKAMGTPAEFNAWLAGQLAKTKETDRFRLAFLVALEALGADGAYRLLTDIRNATPIGGLNMQETLVGELAEGAIEEALDVHTASGDARASTELFLSAASFKDVADAAALLNNMDYEPVTPEVVMDEKAPMAERVELVFARMKEFAVIFDKLLGKGNVMSAALTTRATAINLLRTNPRAKKSFNKPNGLLFTYAGANRKPGMKPALVRALLAISARATAAKAEAKDTDMIGEALARELIDIMFSRDLQLGVSAAKRSAAGEGAKKDIMPVAEQRGALYTILSAFAPTILKGRVRRHGRAVNLTAPKLSPVAQAFLAADKVLTYLKQVSATGAEYAKSLRNAVYADGTPMFWNVIGQNIKTADEYEEVSEPSPEMVRRAARQMSKASGDFYLPLYGGDKTNIFGVLVKKELAQAITGSKDPTYDLVYKTVATVSKLAEFAAKRGPQMVQGFGAELATRPEVTFAVVIPADPNASEDEDNFTKGQAVVNNGAELVVAARRASGNPTQTAVKVHGLGVGGDIVMMKGVFHEASDGKDPAVTPAVKFVHKLSNDINKEAGNGGRDVVVDSLDGHKEGRLGSKTNGVLVNGGIVPAAIYIRNNAEVNESTEVTWQTKGSLPIQGKLSDFLPSLKVRRGMTAEGAGDVVVISYTENISWRIAASLHKSPVSHVDELGKNVARDPGREASVLRGVADQIATAYTKAHPKDPSKFVARDKTLAQMMDNDTVPRLSAQAYESTGIGFAASLVRNTAAKLSKVWKAICTIGGGTSVNGEEKFVTGQDSPFSKPAMSLRDRKDEFGGRLVRPASVAMNIREPGERGVGLYLNMAHKTLRYKKGKGQVEFVREQLVMLEGLRDVSGRATDAYNKFLRDEIMPMFTTLDGKEIPEGFVYSFYDLFDSRGANAADPKSFDYTAFSWGSDSPDKVNGRVYLDGTLKILIRTPSGDPAAWTKARVHGPVSTTDKQPMIFIEEDDKGRTKAVARDAEGRRSIVSADEALVRCPADMLVFTGHDNDGDTLAVQGKEPLEGAADRFDYRDPASVEAALQAVKSPNKEDADAALERVMRGMRNSFFEVASQWWDSEFDAGLTPTGVLKFEAALAEKIDAAVKAAGYEMKKYDPTNVDDAMKMVSLAVNGAGARGIGVANGASYDILVNVLGATPDANKVQERPIFLNATDISKKYSIDLSKGMNQTQWRFFRTVLFARNNLLFDVMKNFGIDVKYGFTQPLMPFHDALLYANIDKVTDMASYAEFLTEWVKFAHGPIGKAIQQRWEAETDPAIQRLISGKYKAKAERMAKVERSVFGKTTNEKGQEVTDLPGAYQKLSRGSKEYVLEGAVAYYRAGGKESVRSVANSLVRLVYFTDGLRDLKSVFEADSDRMATPKGFRTLNTARERLSEFLLGMTMPEASRSLAQSFSYTLGGKMELVEPAFAGSYERSSIRTEISNTLVAAEAYDNSEGMGDIAHRAALAAAAVDFAPAELKAKLGMSANNMESFKSHVEKVFTNMMDTYYASELRGKIPLLDNLIAPFGEGGKAIRAIAADDSDRSLPAIVRSADLLKNGVGDKLNTKMSVIEKTGPKEVVYTGTDLWHLLRIYTVSFGYPSYRMSAKNTSFLPMLGDASMKELMERQVQYFQNATDIKKLIPTFFYMKKNDDGDPSGRTQKVPEVLSMNFGGGNVAETAAWYQDFEDQTFGRPAAREAQKEVATKTTEAVEANPPAAPVVVLPEVREEAPAKEAAQPIPASVEVFHSTGSNGLPVTIRRDPAVEWVASQGPVTMPVDEAIAMKYWAKRTPDAAPEAAQTLGNLVAAANDPKTLPGMQDILNNPASRIERAQKHLQKNDVHGQAASKTAEAIRMIAKLPYVANAEGDYLRIIDGAADAVLKLGAAPELTNGLVLALALETRIRGLSNDADIRAEMLNQLKSFRIVDASANTELLQKPNLDKYFIRQTPMMKALIGAAVVSQEVKTAKQAYEAAAKIRDAIAPEDGQLTASIETPETTREFLLKYSDRANGKANVIQLTVFDDLTHRKQNGIGDMWGAFTHVLEMKDLTIAAMSNLMDPETKSGTQRKTQDSAFGKSRETYTRAHELEALWREFVKGADSTTFVMDNFNLDSAFARVEAFAKSHRIDVLPQTMSVDGILAELDKKDAAASRIAPPVVPAVSAMSPADVVQKNTALVTRIGVVPVRETRSLAKGGQTMTQGELNLKPVTASIENLNDRVNGLVDVIMADADYSARYQSKLDRLNWEKSYDEIRQMVTGEKRKSKTEYANRKDVADTVKMFLTSEGPEGLAQLNARLTALMIGLREYGAYSDIVSNMRAVMDDFRGGDDFRMYADIGRRGHANDKKLFGDRNRVFGDETVRKMHIAAALRDAVNRAQTIPDQAEREAEVASLTDLIAGWRSAKLIALSISSALYHSADARAKFTDASAAPISRPDGTPAEIPQPSALEAQNIDIDGMPFDPLDYKVSIIDADAFYAGAVAPYFRGVGIRDILFDKQALTALPIGVSVSNYIANYFGTRSVTGYLAPITKTTVKKRVMENGTWVETDEEETITKFGRDKLGKQLAAETTGTAFNEDELVMARFAESSLMFIVNSGNGVKSRMVMDGMSLRFADLPKFETEAQARDYAKRHLTLAVADKLAAKAGVSKGDMRTLALHSTLRAHRSAGATISMMEKIEALLQESAVAFMSGEGDLPQREQAAFSYLQDANAVEVRYDKPRSDSSRVVSQAVFAIPVAWVAEEFKQSTAYSKLRAAGRSEADLDFMSPNNDLAKRYRDARRRIAATAASLGVMGASRFMHDAGTASAFFPGNGIHKFNARRAERPQPGKLDAETAKVAEELMSTINSCFRKDSISGLTLAEPLRADDRNGQRMLIFLIDLYGMQTTPEALVKEIKAGAYEGNARELKLSRYATKWDVAKAVYAKSMSRLYEVAMNNGEVSSLKLGQVGLADFNRMIERAALDNNVDGELSEGASWSDIYEITGALPANLTASEHLTSFAQGIATATRYRAAINNVLMSTDEEGMPVVYMRPGANEDDTIPDEVWATVARWWAQTHAGRDGKGAFYDEGRNGKDNAIRLFDEIDRGKHADGTERGVKGGIERYVFETIKDIPEGFGAADKIIAARPRVGDDNQSVFDTMVGGEAAGIVKQILAIPGFGREDTKWAGVNKVLSWSKSSSVMASLFFPIATAVESPAAAVGMMNTIMGMTEGLSKFGRKVGIVEAAPAMKEFFNMIGSDSNFLVDNMVLQTMCGLEFANRAKNMMDHDRTTIAKDINRTVEAARGAFGEGVSRNIRLLLEGGMEHSSEFAFEYVINATKMAVFAQMSAKLRRKALEAGRWWDPVRSMLPYRNYINAEVGGIDPAMYAWMTPFGQKIMKFLMFSAPWTFGAWEAGGGGVLTQKLFGRTTSPEIRGMMMGRWARMYCSVMFGVPMAMQLASVALSKASGDDDEDDKWFTWQNENGKNGKAADITPWLRHMSNSHVLYLPFLPTWGELKQKLPASIGLGPLQLPLGSLIPAATGQEGDNATTRKRRYYLNFGKQGWEVARWFEEPAQSFLSKMSMPAQKVLEGVLGVTPATGWEAPFADMGFWERWTSLDPEKSALLNVVAGPFTPFSVSGTMRNPEAGAISMVGVVSKGMSRTRAVNEMAGMFSEWADATTYVARVKGRPGAWTDLKAMSTEWLEALRMNGYDAKQPLKDAIDKARKPLYEQIHNALPSGANDKGDPAAMEEAARGLLRLDYVYKNLLTSIKGKDKLQNIDRSKLGIGKLSDEMLREAFFNQNGATSDRRATQQAVKGGDVVSFLASDEIPATVLGYKVIGPDQLTPEDVQFFQENPEAAGFFDKEGK